MHSWAKFGYGQISIETATHSLSILNGYHALCLFCHAGFKHVCKILISSHSISFQPIRIVGINFQTKLAENCCKTLITHAYSIQGNSGHL